MKKILLFGSTGFIGSHLKDALEEKGYEVADPRIEIRNLDEVSKTIQKEAPDYIINATGITGKPNVDWCEDQPVETYSVNVGGSLNIAVAAMRKGIKVAQLSSGCVYSGDKNGEGWNEEDPANFFGSVYSRSRVACELALKDFPNVLQLRIRIPILGKSHPKNLIDKLLKYPKMINIKNSCTVIEDFVPAAIQLMEMGTTGIVNMTNQGAMDHKAIMSLYKEIVDPSFEMNFMSEEEQDALCVRRSNCVLSTDKREQMGVHMPPLEESLRRILANY
jgi:3,5-epimerase/4-reductase